MFLGEGSKFKHQWKIR